MRRRILVILGGLSLAIAAVGVAGGAALFGPTLLDDRALDQIVRWVALDWRDFGEEAARTRLQLELDKQRIGLQVRDDDCELVEDGTIRVVRCAWDAVVVVPFLDVRIPVSYASEARIDAEGRLR